MAADLNPEWLSCLPSSWSYGVTRDGRVFFINEEAKSTTWLHPVTGEAVITGHRKTPDLPTGWEEGYTFEGARCFIKKSTRSTLRDWIQQSCGQSAYDYSHQTLEQENGGCFRRTDGVQSLALGFCSNGRVMLTVYDPANRRRMTYIIILFDTVADLDKAIACV
ncbi:pleckstrin homology domain-containing family A member 5 isoform X16 [Onychostoma macrolepis]|nr:pleckstrin homology domain-containing family A member 5 isoform X16 [Onychostoma macrolepis]